MSSRATNPDHFGKTILYDEASNYVHIGNFSIKNGLTAHQRMSNQILLAFRQEFINVAKVHGGSIKKDGTIEMKSGTFNGITFIDLKDRPEFIPFVKDALDQKRINVITDQNM